MIIDYDKLIESIYLAIYFTTGEYEDYSERILPVLKRHFEQFEKDVADKADKATKVATFKPAGQSLLEALKAGAENPVVKGDVCPVCANGTDICSYCARNFEE